MRDRTGHVARRAYSVTEVAEQLGCCRETILRMIEAGDLPAFRLSRTGRAYRIRAEDVEQLINTPAETTGPAA